MVAACFSLWRAAFLADKTGSRYAAINDAKTFLGKMLTDNAINYPQDRNAREWTFNYYMKNARHALFDLAKDSIDVETALLTKPKTTKGSTVASRRWDQYQEAFDVALKKLGADLRAAKEVSTV